MKKRSSMVFAAAMAALCASAEPTVSNVTAKQRYPWNGLVDITCKVTGISGTTNGLKFAVKAVIPDTGDTRSALNFWVVKDGTNSTDLEVHANGNYRLLWDARADFGQMRHTNMVVRVTFVAHNFTGHDNVQLWAGGPYWATTNIGANEPWDYGYYFWWGDTVGYNRSGGTWTDDDGVYGDYYSGVTWVASDGSTFRVVRFDGDDPICGQTWPQTVDELNALRSWTADNVLVPERDAAHVQWGGNWRLPTYQELRDLCDNCDWTWTTTNGVNGYVIRGRGDYVSASIFLPCAGFGEGASLRLAGSYGSYWSSNPCPGYNHGEGTSFIWTAWDLSFNSSSHYTFYYDRYIGQSVRPVQGFTE